MYLFESFQLTLLNAYLFCLHSLLVSVSSSRVTVKAVWSDLKLLLNSLLSELLMIAFGEFVETHLVGFGLSV